MESQLHRYGDDPSQYGVLYGEGPVAVLIHGGFWKDQYGLDLMEPLAEDLAARGWAAWNIEYRRLGNGGGVPETLDDVSAAIDLLADLPRGPQSRRGDRPQRRRAPGGVGGDPRERARGRHRRRLPGGRAGPRSARASCGSPTASSTASCGDHPTSVASPIERLPLGVPALLTHGGLDDIVPVEISAALRGGQRRVADRRARRGPLRPHRPGQPALEGGAGMAVTRDDALQLDADDPLAPFRDRFVIDDEHRLYLDGNSLGRLPEGHARAPAPHDRPVGRGARRRLARLDRRAHPDRRRARRGARRRAPARSSSPTASR